MVQIVSRKCKRVIRIPMRVAEKIIFRVGLRGYGQFNETKHPQTSSNLNPETSNV